MNTWQVITAAITVAMGVKLALTFWYAPAVLNNALGWAAAGVCLGVALCLAAIAR